MKCVCWTVQSMYPSIQVKQWNIIFTSMILMKRGNTGFLLTAIRGTFGNTSGTIIGVSAVIWGPLYGTPPSPPDSSPPESALSPPSSPEKPEPLVMFPNILLWIICGPQFDGRRAGWARKTAPTRAHRRDLPVKVEPSVIVASPRTQNKWGLYVLWYVPALV